MTLTDVTVTDCPYCNRLACDDYLTCPGYLRALLERMETAPPARGRRALRGTQFEVAR